MQTGLERHGGFDVAEGWPSVAIFEAAPAGTGSSAGLLTEAGYEPERHRRSGR